MLSSLLPNSIVSKLIVSPWIKRRMIFASQYTSPSQSQSLDLHNINNNWAQAIFDFQMDDAARFNFLFANEGNIKRIWQFIYLCFADNELFCKRRISVELMGISAILDSLTERTSRKFTNCSNYVA